MKTLMLFIAISFALILAACSNTEQDITSPVSTELVKSPVEIQSFPFEVYQIFPELKSARVSWQNEKEGITIFVSDISDRVRNSYLFAIIEFANDEVVTLAFLGDLKSGNFYLPGLTAEKIRAINIFNYDLTLSPDERPLPYPKSQIIKNIRIKAWADGGAYVKVSSYPFTPNTRQLFAQLVASESNQLIFLGKPQSENFTFPKSEKLNLNDIKLFKYEK
jgi:hypothetical protein